MNNVSYYLLLDHIKIHGANAISSPLTYGFPAITGFLGAIHALSRKTESIYHEAIYLDGVMIACYDCDVQVYRKNDFADYRFKLTRNPIGKDGKPKAIIQEGKVHLDVSLVIEVRCNSQLFVEQEQKIAFESWIKQQLLQQRMAGGSVLSIDNVWLFDAMKDPQEIIKRLLPAYVLIDANQQLQAITQELQAINPEMTGLDALVETAKLHYIPSEDGWQTQSVKKDRGWLVPIHMGYQAISPLFEKGAVAHIRDEQCHAQFVECLYGLGQWVFPYRLIGNFDGAFWRYRSMLAENDANLYLIQQDKINI
ncbi:MAG: type I-F CRISPR-associated protein Csy2 [Candidatus Schmidhempelia sp.]|nr:type I-F CRISPR-associated protein Csy2 [Candidatus Schmidhempelia sp.]